MTVDGCARRMLVRSSSDEDHDPGPCTADERARITVYEGDHATSHAITYKSGLRQFESAAGACVSCEEAEDEELSYELARALPLADRVLYDPGLHKAISLVNLRQPETEPIAIGIPLAIALCCVRLKVAYDKDGWSGSAEFNCTCL